MPDRIDKTYQKDPWYIEASKESQRDRPFSGEGEGESADSNQKDDFVDLHEKTDWKILLENDPAWKENRKLGKHEIRQIFFQKINLKTDPSLVSAEIILNSGEKLYPAYFPISRLQGLKLKFLTPGELMPLETLIPEGFLTVTLPKTANVPIPQTQPEQSGTEQSGTEQSRTEQSQPEPAQSEKTAETIIQEMDEDKTEIANQADLFLEFIKVRDPLTKQLNIEMAVAYGLGLLFLIILFWGASILN